MSVGERLFGAAHRAVRRWLHPGAPAAHQAAAAKLEELTQRLRLLAQLVAGAPLDVRVAEGAGGLRGATLHLPAVIELFDSAERNLDLYRLRTIAGAAVYAHGQRTGDDPELAMLIAVERTLPRLDAEWPGSIRLRARLAAAIPPPPPGASDLDRWADRLLRAPDARPDDAPPRARRDAPRTPQHHLLWGRWSPAATDAPTAAVPDITSVDGSALPRGTERRGKPRETVTTTTVSTPEDGDNPLMHVFEKLFTAEEYSGGKRRADGSDELDEHCEALDELELRHVVRTAEATSSIYQADLQNAGEPVDLLEEQTDCGAIHYDEWDATRRRYRRSWCALRAHPPDPLASPETVRQRQATVRHRYAAQIRRLRDQLLAAADSRRPVPRQRAGEDIDIDALTNQLATLEAARQGHPAVLDDRLYVARGKPAPDVAALVLVDCSLSTDAWVEGRRVLDVALDAVLILGEVAGDRDLPIAVAGFYSNSRRDCHYVEVKDFDTPWRDARRALLGLRPTGYTRIGPALRHATAQLRRASARRKLLLLVSDGKPTDYDRYEGRHGIADVRQALREAHRDGIDSFALAIQKNAVDYLPQLFGRGGYRVLPSADRLPASLLQLARRQRS